MSATRTFIGLSCGSGGEGVDAALVETSGIGLNLTTRCLLAIRKAFARDVSKSLAPSALHRLIGETSVAAVQQLVAQARIDANRPLAIGFLGMMHWHEPDRRAPSSQELGMTSLLADRLGITVVSDFREQDVAAGGQGMPVSAVADTLLFRHPSEARTLIHLGGVTSVVYIPPGGLVQKVFAFEAGPCNRMLDLAIQLGMSGRERFDPGGRHAVQGRCLESLLEDWLKNPFFQIKPPKSLSRSAYATDFITEAMKQTATLNGTLQDLLCTLSHFAIRTLVATCRQWLPSNEGKRTVNLSGGGAKNGMLWRLLQQYAPDWELARLDDLSVPSQARNAVAAGILAALTLDGVPASTPSATGAVGRLLGRITPGSTSNWGRCLRWMAEQSGELIHPYRAA